MRYFHFFIFICISVLSVSASAADFPDAPHLSVTGTASLDVTPDQVQIRFQASALAVKGSEAKEKVDQQVGSLINSLKTAGFNLKALDSADLYTRVEYDYQKGKRTFLGIRATRDLNYLLTDLSKVNLFLDSVLSADIELIGQLEYSLQSPKQWQLKVRQMAVDDSMEKASALAQAYQAELGKIYSLNYQKLSPRPLMIRAVQDELTANSYQTKTISINDSVHAVFLLKP